MEIWTRFLKFDRSRYTTTATESLVARVMNNIVALMRENVKLGPLKKVITH